VSERRRAPVRPVLLAVLALLGVAEIQTILHTLRAQTRLRQRIIHAQEALFMASWPEVSRTLGPGGKDAWERGLEQVLERVPSASEAEVFDMEGRLLAAQPYRAPVSHWPQPSRMPSILSGRISSEGPVAGEETRLLTYAAFPSGAQAVVVRLASRAPELLEDLRERRALLVGHGLMVVFLAVAAGLVLLPAPAPPAESPHGVSAYAEALGRLRDMGEAQNQKHQVERDRLAGEMRDLEAMARAGELAAGIAHEVRNGLGTILGYARLIERSASPETSEQARRILQECQTLEVVVRRFVAFVRRETLDPRPFDLRAMLRRVIARESAHRPVGSVDLTGAEDFTFVGDEELLERVFENVVRNACEAAGSTGNVRVGIESGSDRVTVSVEDDGPGWPNEAGTFQPFGSTKPGGLGLGLPLARKLARLHGGDVGVVPSDRGARVEVTLSASPTVETGGET
jgi:signal transduction histidine kinase